MARGFNVWRRQIPEPLPVPLIGPEGYSVRYTCNKLWLSGAIKDQVEVDEVVFALNALRQFLPEGPANTQRTPIVADWHQIGPMPIDPELEEKLARIKHDGCEVGD